MQAPKNCKLGRTDRRGRCIRPLLLPCHPEWLRFCPSIMRIFFHIGMALFVFASALENTLAQQLGVDANPSAMLPLKEIGQLRVYVESKNVVARQVALEGVVTWLAASGEAFVLQEGTNAMRFDLQAPGMPVRAGQRVRADLARRTVRCGVSPGEPDSIATEGGICRRWRVQPGSSRTCG